MKKTVLLLSLVAAGFLAAQETSFKGIAWPEGKDTAKNLFSNPEMQPASEVHGVVLGWSNYSSKRVAVSWVTVDGKKILKSVSGQPGYHLGLFRGVKGLKSSTQYQMYLIARGKVSGDGSKLRVLYVEGRVPGKKQSLFVRDGGIETKDFDWKLFTCKFVTPADFKDGSCSIYAALFYGTAELEIARIGLMEIGPAAAK